jgi:acyl-CoA synthetase (AMP-forming)/AMP-acid ligase II
VLIELLRKGAADAPDQPLVISADGELSYERCLARSEALAAGLARRSARRLACLVADAGEVLALLCAASAVGAEPCVYRPTLEDPLIREFTEAFGHRLVISDRPIAVGGVEVVTVDELAVARADDGGSGPLAPDRAPVLILTTGTTGRPKAARHDWSRLLAGVRTSESLAATRWLLAYNLNQFAGLQILLYTLANRATLVVPASNQPREALADVVKHGVTHVSATPTFWRMALGLLGPAEAAALPLRQITLGGEAVPSPLLDELVRLFPQARVSQVYASTEFGSSTSVRDRENGLPASVLDRAQDADVRFKIVDGELHACSRVGMLGYLGQDDVGDDWRPTGDLVELRDGRIHFVGRVSEVVNVGGVKVHPLPVEEVVASVEGVELAHAYGRANAVTGEIMAVDVVARADVDTDVLKEAIRAACETLPPAARPRRIRFVDVLADQGKINRRREPAAQ